MDENNVVNLPPRKEPPDLLIGPFEVWKVSVEGRIIPGLTGHPDGNRIALVVDGRFSASFPKELAHDAAWLIAQALAIGAGYPSLGAETKGRPFAPIGCQVGGGLTEEKP